MSTFTKEQKMILKQMNFEEQPNGDMLKIYGESSLRVNPERGVIMKQNVFADGHRACFVEFKELLYAGFICLQPREGWSPQ